MPITLPNIQALVGKIKRECDIEIHKMGAIVFTRNGRVLGMACNRKGEGYVSNYSYHAEEMALRRTLRKRSYTKEKIYLLVIRVTSRGTYNLARPCYPCYQLCKEAGIEQIFYTDVNGTISRS